MAIYLKNKITKSYILKEKLTTRSKNWFVKFIRFFLAVLAFATFFQPFPTWWMNTSLAGSVDAAVDAHGIHCQVVLHWGAFPDKLVGTGLHMVLSCAHRGLYLFNLRFVNANCCSP